MSFLAHVQIYCFLMSYVVSLTGEAWIVLRRQSNLGRIVVLAFAMAGFFAHTAYLLTRSRSAGLPPLLSSQQDWLLVLAWIGSLLYLVLLMTHRKMAHGLFMLPAILLLITVAIFANEHATGQLDQMALRRLGMFHAASLVLGIAAVVGAALSGLMYLLHHQRLRNRSGWIQKIKLPSLENLTAINRWMVVFSVPCLTIGMATGFVLIAWSRGLKGAGSVPWMDPTIVTTIVVWIAMIVVLIRVLTSSHQTGKAVAQLSLLSGGFLLATMLGPMVLSGAGNLSMFHSGSFDGRDDKGSDKSVDATPDAEAKPDTKKVSP